MPANEHTEKAVEILAGYDRERIAPTESSLLERESFLTRLLLALIFTGLFWAGAAEDEAFEAYLDERYGVDGSDELRHVDVHGSDFDLAALDWIASQRSAS